MPWKRLVGEVTAGERNGGGRKATVIEKKQIVGADAPTGGAFPRRLRSSGRGMIPSNEQRSAEGSVKAVGSPGGPSRAFGSPTKGSIERVASEAVLFGGARLSTRQAASRETSGGQEGRSGRGRRESCTKSL